MTRLDGFDIYHLNVITDASKIPAYPVAVHKLTEGSGSKDPLAADRLAMFTARGISRRGGYHWLRTDSTLGAQFQNFRAAINATTLVDKSGALVRGSFLMLDWERTSAINDPSQAMAEDWCGLVAQTYGDRQCVYTAAWMPMFSLWRKAHPDMPLWFAAYGNYQQTANGFGSMCWQFTDKAIVPGFAKPVDGNTILRADVLDRICGLTQPAPIPIPLPHGVLVDGMNVALISINGDPTQFLAAVTGKGVALQAEWTGDGNDPKVRARIAAHVNAGAVAITVNRGDLANVALLGPLPPGYTAADFARVVA